MDKDAVKILQNGISIKEYMSKEQNTFVGMFEYGNSNNKQGYWIYEHLVLQMEDCLDWLNFLYTYFDLVFLFENMCGHDRAREGILKTSIMRKYFGGKQQNMRDKVILEEDTLSSY